MDAPGPSTEAAKPTTKSQPASPKKRSRKKSLKKLNIPTPASAPPSGSTSRCNNPTGNNSSTSVQSPSQPSTSGCNNPAVHNSSTSVQSPSQSSTSGCNNPAVHNSSTFVQSPSQSSTSNQSPITPVPGSSTSPFLFQSRPQNHIPPFNPANMVHTNGESYNSETALQDFLLKSLKINQQHNSGYSQPHPDSLRITVNNQLTQRSVQKQTFQPMGTRATFQFNFPASVPFQYDQPLQKQSPNRRPKQGNAQANIQKNAEGNVERNAERNEDPYKKVTRQANAQANIQRNVEGNVERNAERNEDPYKKVNRQANAQANIQRNAEGNVERNAERNEDPYKKVTRQANAQANIQRNAERNVERNAERNEDPYKKVTPAAHQLYNWRQKGGREYDDEDFYRKVIVTGFPAFSKPEEIVRHLSVVGAARIEIIKNRVAVVVFGSQREALAAVGASDTIAMYGAILTILRYVSRRQAMDLMKANRRVVKAQNTGPSIVSPKEIDLSGDFYDQIRNIEQAIRLTADEVLAVSALFEDIEKYMRMIYPTCTAVPFGSITTGQGIKSSDADCFLALRAGAGGRPGGGAAEHSAAFVTRAVRVMRVYPDVFSQIVAIPKANTPIVKFLHKPTNMCCDLNSKTPLGVQNSRLLGHFLAADPDGRLGSVALLLKYWARAQQLSGTGKLTNYALTLLLVAYLQRILLPSVVSLQGGVHSFMVDKWDAGFDAAPLRLASVPPMRDILGGFFLHYAGFDFEELVVCPFYGKPLRKAEFDCDVLPAEFALYRRNVADKQCQQLRTGRPLCVQDPFELSHNVASAVSSRLAAELKAHITMAAASYTAGEKVPGDFLRTILLTAPAPELGFDTRVATRVCMPPRLLAGLPADWRAAVRATVLDDCYGEILDIDLTRRDAVSREPEVDIEVYVGLVTRPLWMRGYHTNARCPRAADKMARHKLITGRIAGDDAMPAVRVPFEVELGFRESPRAVSITTTAMDGAEPAAFRAFRHFSHTFIHRWCRELLQPRGASQPNNPPPKHKPARARPNVAKERASKATQPPIETVAFVNTNHKDLTESIATISLSDGDNDTT